MFKNTRLFFLKEDLINEFGKEDGESLYNKTEEIYKSLLPSVSEYKTDGIKNHLTSNLFPTMAYYKALLDASYTKDKALFYVRKETTKAATIIQIKNHKLTKIPFTYLLYRKAIKKVMKKSYPKEGFETEWICCNKKEIHFNMRRCIYRDLTKKYGCEELCTVFCENDNITFKGLMPKIRFERTKTLGQGQDMCDFHLINNKKK